MRAAVGLFLIIALSTGCSGETASSGSRQTTPASHVPAAERPTAADLRWVGDLEYWYYLVTRQSVAGCADLFDQQVGSAPSDRLQAEGEAARAACEDLERGTADEGQALASGDDQAIGKASELIRGGEAELDATLKRAHTLVPDVSKPLPRIESPSARSRIDPYLTQVATRVVGAPTEVRCWSTEDWRRLSAWAEASAFAWEGSAHFATRTCGSIVRLHVDNDRRAAAGFLGIFSHELQHAGGINEEDKTECYGIQAMARVGVALGLTNRAARALQLLYWRELYELNNSDYRSEECREGGALDLHTTTSRWP